MNPLQFLAADEYMLKKRVFNSITGTYWYRRLRGHEIDDFDTKLGMIGRQWVLRDPTNKDDLLVFVPKLFMRDNWYESEV